MSNNRILKNFKIEKEIAEKFSQIAEEKGSNFSVLLRILIIDCIKEHEKEKRDSKE